MAISRANQNWPDSMILDIPETTGYYLGSPEFENLVVLEAESEIEAEMRRG